jgi:predicted glycosyltransferase involved in capsule biosynthesis
MKISFGTSCMGRLDDLKKTYLQNIDLCIRKGLECEFILLNWNSPDNLNNWAENNLDAYIKQGLVKYLVNCNAKEFSQAKTKNTTLKNSTGSILCTLDADNLLNSNFISIIQDSFSSPNSDNIILQCKGGPMAGRIIFTRENFLKLRGFDESMKGWGYEDRDFVNRFCRVFSSEVITLPHGDCGRAFHRGESSEKKHQKLRQLRMNRRISNINLRNKNFYPNNENWGTHFDYEK